MKVVLTVLGLLVAGVAVPVLVARYVWRTRTAGIVDRLKRAGTTPRSSSFSEAELAGLPAPVVRYFRVAMRNGQPIIRHVRLTQRGDFLVRPTPGGWQPFVATQHFATHPPGFVWDAHIRVVPGLSVRVRDAFVEGAGSMVGRLMGLWQVVGVEGTPEIASGALHRYLAEAVWFPTALLPNQGVRWTAVDDSNARAALTVGTTTTSLDYSFSADGLVTGIFAPGRARVVNGRAVPTPRRVRVARYEQHSGMNIPMTGEVEWHLPEGPEPY